MTRPALPAYSHGLIAAYLAGQSGRDLHLGYWDRPPDPAVPASPAEFAAAQARLTERAIAFAPVQPKHRILDIGCGLGGTLPLVAARTPDFPPFGLHTH